MATKKTPAIFKLGQMVDDLPPADSIVSIDTAKAELKVIANDPDLMDLADMGDMYWQTREQRLKMKKEVDEVELREKQLLARILERMERLHLTAIGGKVVTLVLKTTYEPQITDWPTFYSYVQETGEFDLLYRRINPASIKQRWESDVQVPGVAKFPVTKLAKSGVK